MGTEKEDIRRRTACALAKMREDGSRRRMVLKRVVWLVVCFIGHSIVTRWETPLKFIPQTMLAVMMGVNLLQAMSVHRFPYIAKYIDWDSVDRDAGA